MEENEKKAVVVLLLVILASLLTLSGCGSDACVGVDTSQAPDKITYSGNFATYYWGDCAKTLQIRE